MLLDDVLDDGGEGFAVADVELDGSSRADLRRDLAGEVDLAVGKDGTRAPANELGSEGAADTGGAAGDDGDSTVKGAKGVSGGVHGGAQ